MFEDKVGKATAAYHECFDSEWRCVLKHLPKLYMTLYEFKVMMVLLHAFEIWAGFLAWKELVLNPAERFRLKASFPMLVCPDPLDIWHSCVKWGCLLSCLSLLSACCIYGLACCIAILFLLSIRLLASKR